MMATVDVCKSNTSSVAVVSDSDGNSKHGQRSNKKENSNRNGNNDVKKITNRSKSKKRKKSEKWECK